MKAEKMFQMLDASGLEYERKTIDSDIIGKNEIAVIRTAGGSQRSLWPDGLTEESLRVVINSYLNPPSLEEVKKILGW